MSTFPLWNRLRNTRICLGLGVCIVLGGCTVSNRSAYIDSTSRMPWFGLELKGRKPKSDDPPFRSVRLDNRDDSQVAPAGLFTGNATTVVKPASSSGTSRMALPVSEQNVVISSPSDPSAPQLDFH